MANEKRHKPSKRKNPVRKVKEIVGHFEPDELKQVPAIPLATAYAMCIVHEQIYGRGSMDWKPLNEFLIERFDMKGLDMIKSGAWKTIEKQKEEMLAEKRKKNALKD